MWPHKIWLKCEVQPIFGYYERDDIKELGEVGYEVDKENEEEGPKTSGENNEIPP